MLRLASSILLSAVIILLLSVPAVAEHENIFNTFTLHYENDFLSGTDRDYTSGLKLTWSTPYTNDAAKAGWPSFFYPLMSRLPLVNNPRQQKAVSLSIGQEIFTPGDKKNPDLIVDDRPYAGRTYIAAGFHSKTERKQHTWELNIGIVGPASYAEDSQKLVHKINGATDPKGWDNQLDNEITVDAVFETQWKVGPPQFPQTFSYDFIPHAGARLGTVNIYANAGAEFRFGWDLPSDFGSCPIRAGCEVNSAFEKKDSAEKQPEKKIGVHFFIATDGRVILRDIYLDGNTFTDSHSVDKKYFVADLIGGVSVRYGNVKTILSHISRTKQFDGQDDGQDYSSLSISWMY